MATAAPLPAAAPAPPRGREWVSRAWERVNEGLVGLGDWSLFSSRVIAGVAARAFPRSELIAACVRVGVSSAGVVVLTGAFIGMVLAVQSYSQFRAVGLETSLGAVIHMSVVRELGPVLAAVMLAGRVGTAMAAELATMRVTEQIDAYACLGVDPVRFLAGPRFVACLLMIPLLTVVADAMGLVGSNLISLYVYRIDSHHYWEHSRNFVTLWDLGGGILKSLVFGGVLSLIACHRGFHSGPGALGVGRAATQAFVYAFVAILALDLLMTLFINTLHDMWFPAAAKKVA